MNNDSKISGILHRLKIAPASMRRGVCEELIEALNTESDWLAHKKTASATNTIGHLRNLLTWPEVKADGLAVARICRSLRSLRETP